MTNLEMHDATHPVYRFEDEDREFDEDDDTAGEIVGFEIGV